MCKKCLITFLIFLAVAVGGFFIVLKAGAEVGSVVINEVAWMGSLPEGEESATAATNDEWIELYNQSSEPVDLDGWILKSTDGAPLIELSGTIGPEGFFLLERTDDNTISNVQSDFIYTGALGNGGEHLQLINSSENIVDEVNASSGWPKGNNSTKRTMERVSPSSINWQDSENPGGTPKAQNSVYSSSPAAEEKQPLEENPTPEEATHAQEPDSQPQQEAEEPAVVAPPPSYSSYIFLNEIMPYPVGSDSTDEWIELINSGKENVDLTGWQIRDVAGSVKTYTFPEGSFINKGTFLVLSRPTTKIALNNDSDGLELLHPDKNIADSVKYADAPRDSSYSKSSPGWLWSETPTPGSINIITLPPNESAEEKSKPTPSLLTRVIHLDSPEEESEEQEIENIQPDQEEPAYSTITASISDTFASKTSESENKNTLAIVLAIIIAISSGIFIFIVKKRVSHAS